MGHWIVKGRAEFETTDLGAAAFDGKVDEVRDAIRAGVNWSEEGQQPLIAALYGEHFELARELLRAGSPVDETTYRLLFHHSRELLSELPPNPELISSLERDERWMGFVFAVFQGDLEKATQLLNGDVRRRINEQTLFSHGIGKMAPLHYAARTANVPLLRLVVSAGADVHALAENGKSALRLVAEAPSVEDRVRREAIELLEGAGAEFVPPVTGFWTRWATRRGSWLPPG